MLRRRRGLLKLSAMEDKSSQVNLNTHGTLELGGYAVPCILPETSIDELALPIFLVSPA